VPLETEYSVLPFINVKASPGVKSVMFGCGITVAVGALMMLPMLSERVTVTVMVYPTSAAVNK
jgi:hypothetical protein